MTLFLNAVLSCVFMDEAAAALCINTHVYLHVSFYVRFAYDTLQAGFINAWPLVLQNLVSAVQEAAVTGRRLDLSLSESTVLPMQFLSLHDIVLCDSSSSSASRCCLLCCVRMAPVCHGECNEAYSTYVSLLTPLHCLYHFIAYTTSLLIPLPDWGSSQRLSQNRPPPSPRAVRS